MGRRSPVPRAVGLVAAVAWLALVPCARADGPAPVRLDRLVPAGTRAFACLDGLGRPIQQRWRETAPGRMLADPEVAAAVDPALDGLRRALAAAARGSDTSRFLTPAAADALRQLGALEGQAALALVAPDGSLRRDWMLCLDFGARLREFTAFLSRLASERAGLGWPARAEAGTGGTSWVLGAEGSPFALHVQTIGTAILASTDAKWVEDRVRTAAARVDDALAEDPGYVRARSRVGPEGPGLFAYLDPRGGLADVLTLLSLPNPDAVAKALGLGERAPVVAYRASFEGDGFLQTTVLETAPPGAGPARAPGARPTSRALLRWAPRTALFASVQALDAPTFVARLRELSDLADPDRRSLLQRALHGSPELLGPEAERALLAGFGDESVCWLGLPETGGVFPEAGFAVALRDPAAFEKALEAAIDGVCERVGAEGEIRATARAIPFHGTRLHVVDLEGTRPRDVVWSTPTWAILDGRLLVTAVPHALKEIVLRVEAGEPGLAGEDDVRALLAAMPADASSFTYLDGRALLAAVYDTTAPLLQSLGREVVERLPFAVDVARLPPTRVVRPYLRSTAASFVDEPGGLRCTVLGPVPVLPVLAAGALLSAWLDEARAAPPAPEAGAEGSGAPGASVSAPEPREEAFRTLRRVAAALEEYAALEGALPESLDDLVAKAHLLGRLPADPWGRPVRWTLDADGRRGTVASAGADGVPGNDDDVIVEVEPAAK